MKKVIYLSCIALVMQCALASCQKENSGNNPDEKAVPIVLSQTEAEINDCSNEFGFKVYHELYKDEQMLFSPLSLSLTLSMTACGADGETASQICDVLGFRGFTSNEIAQYYKTMLTSLVSIDKTTRFEAPNSIWYDPDLKIKQGFLSTVKDNFNAECSMVDFKNADATANSINSWCSNKTHGLIPGIIKKEQITPDMVIALINALYFKGKWSTPFFSETKTDVFHTIYGSTSEVEMMHVQDEILYSDNEEGWQLIGIPYGNGAFRMDVILPPSSLSFQEAVLGFNNNIMKELDEFHTNIEELYMPKFCFEDSYDNLKEALKNLGITDAFDFLKADFSNISDLPTYITLMKQKCSIDVDTKGTTAAALTIAGGDVIAPYTITVNRPFIFIIRETSTGAIIFMGQKVC